VKLAAVVITLNEEANVARCLKSLTFCDEIIVVDSESTDRTVEIAKSLNVTVRSRPWKGYSDQKNFANSLTDADWILSVDADEEVSPELAKEILALRDRGFPHDAYSLPRKTFHLGRWIRFGGWYPNRLVRLFHKGRGEWRGSELHERWETSGSLGELGGDLLHYSFTSLADQVERNNRYSTLGALQLSRRGTRFSLYALITKTFSKFVETYLLKRGFLDGYPGFIISVSAAYSVFLKWAKLWELERCGKKEESKL